MNIRAALATAAIAATFSSSNLPAQLSATDYPQWRGQNRDGVASGFSAPAEWPDTLRRVWKTEVGPGYATPLLVGDRVFVFARIDDDEVMMSLNAKTGDIIWKSGYTARYVPSKPAAAHGAGPKATPTFHGGKLFTLGISGIVAAFDATTGKLLWKTPPPLEPPFFSAASSPVADGSLVFTHPGNYDPLTALDTVTGNVKWAVGDGGFFASPTIATLGGVRQVVTVTQKNVIGVSIPAGTLLWQFPFAGAAGGTMPILYDETVIVSGLDQGVIAFTPTYQDGKWTTVPRWSTKEVSMYLSNPVVTGDTLFGFSHRQSGQYFALDARSGVTLWRGIPREANNAAVATAGDLLFFINDDAQLIVAQRSRSALDVIRRFTVADAATWAQPVLSGKRILIRDVSAVTMWSVN
jgi:outer membrane protein assembly factor BamB